MKAKWIFIHGGWGGSWQWTPLQENLKSRNIESYALDMPGMGSPDGENVSLHDFIDHASQIIENEPGRINIAAFSFGGMTATALAEKYSDRIDKLVYIDAFVPDPGQSFSRIAGEKITRQIKAYSEVMGENKMIPPFFETDERYSSHPLETLFSPVNYCRDKLSRLNPVYIECTDKDPEWTFTPLLRDMARSVKKRGWNFSSLHSDHMPMYSHTEELCELLI